MNCTVLVHGFFSAGLFMNFLSKKIKEKEMDTITPSFPTTTKSVNDCAVLLDKFLRDKIEQYEKVNFVGHSMGGLIIRKYLLNNCPKNIGRCVFLGTPHKGSVLADFGSNTLHGITAMLGGVKDLKTSKKDKYILKDIEIGCIAGTKQMAATAMFFGNKINDGEVEISSALSTDAKEVFVLNFTHIELCKQVQTAHLVKKFLEHGTFLYPADNQFFIKNEDTDQNLPTQGSGLLKRDGLPSMPNIPFPTMGGQTFWNELANVKGWRIQQNMITQHCRVLNPDNVRVAWGGIESIMKTFERLVKNSVSTA